MARIPLSRLRRRLGTGRVRETSPTPLVATACYAPHTNLFLGTTGDVYPCCDSIGYPLGNVAEQRLPDIWAGARLRALREALARDDYSLGCGYCERRLSGGVRPQSRFYDEIPPLAVEPAYPRRIEFNISNACNLQCVMCDGDLSSSIRLHRERRPPLPRAYGDEFFADVVPFVDALEDASFTGGEPFLGAENHRIWDLLIERNPGVKHTVTTNGTRWDRREGQGEHEDAQETGQSHRSAPRLAERAGARDAAPTILSSTTEAAMRFSGRTVLITGAAQGIGLACARALVAGGARVLLAGRREAVLAEAAAALGPEAGFVVCDVTDDASVEAAGAAAGERLG
ncbi:MAG TPA: SDR family NAD(P)-dependent oxidoreductase, partial [Acidimicrobiales bacterium]|nr:SDR family NAD(P)-dependent oxidoreductase [Acidimicrobiales bacterium]